MNCHSARELLPMLVDNELDTGRRRDLDHHLQTCVSCAEAHHRLTSLSEIIRGGAPYYSAPEGLESRILSAIGKAPEERREVRVPWRWAGGSAAVGFAAAMVLAMFVLRPGSPQQRTQIARELVADHVRSLMGNHLVDVASTDQHTVKPWFNGKLTFSPKVKDLAAQGFPLEGGRLDYVDRTTAAALVFRRRQHIINVFVWPSTSGEAGRGAGPLDGFNAVPWSADGLEYWAVSDLNAEELGSFVRLYRE